MPSSFASSGIGARVVHRDRADSTHRSECPTGLTLRRIDVSTVSSTISFQTVRILIGGEDVRNERDDPSRGVRR